MMNTGSPGSTKLKIFLRVLLTLALASIGAILAQLAHLPAAPLLGATLLVSLASLCRIPTGISPWIRNMAFASIGCSLGSGINHDLFQLAAKWPLSLVWLTAAMAAILMSGVWMLKCFFSYSKETALLASSPGAMSYSLAAAAAGVGDAKAITFIQSIRLFSIISCLPLLIDALPLGHPAPVGINTPTLDWLGTAALFLTALAVGYLLELKRIPAGFLIAGVIVSGLSHYFGLLSGQPQPLFLLIGFVVTGAVVGSRFSFINLAEIRRLLLASLTIVVTSIFVSALFAAIVSSTLGLPLGQVWVAFAPGGVEAMAAMALAMGYDSAYVAVHHLYRIIVLLILLPVLLSALQSSKKKGDQYS